ncbi:glycogen synthase GlgA [Methylovirgula sp. 4M-Z18]|uniref:glycogen synthase GlgA n=1 Tax=Methylovirgula sp. 4M-Z18 TaxID=2293567 RepID=UPI000E2F9668|nr:glycogen synthase GlgA [Methylovirgula sp. 4M-Z18]RFB74994.1 glycogen synthase GlgA [Methylovirgula sp. 4M-Z18]
MSDLRVLSVASEIYPLIKTGGLADVAGALPLALAKEGVEMRSLVPGYPAVIKALQKPSVVHTYGHIFGGAAKVLAGTAAGLELFVLDAPHLFDRAGNPYSGPDGRDWQDNAFRFAALARAAADIGLGAVAAFVPDVVHAHDWQAGLAPAYLHYADGPRPGTVITVHNLAFQGQFPPHLLGQIGLPARAYAVDGVEYYNTIGYLKAGLQLADRVTTVSPTYAVEIRGADAGMGLDGLLRQRAGVLSGILNGIDTDVWNPATDAALPASFDVAKISGRAKSKALLQERFGLEVNPNALVFGVVSRLSQQKGLDLLLATLPTLLGEGCQLALLGAGDKGLEYGFHHATATNPGRIGTYFGYDETVAHLIQAGSDAILVPSRFEPCGLTQLCALRYGAIPVVARVGGLADTVIDMNEMAFSSGVGTGVQFAPPTVEMLDAAIRRTAALWRDQTVWKGMQRRAMKTDVSWTNPARQYAKLYRDLIGAQG